MKQKAFLRSFIKRIEFEPGQVKVNYTIPMPIKTDKTCEREVLSIEQSGGADGIRTHYLLTASQTLSRLSYSPNLIQNITNNAGKLKSKAQAQPL